MYYIYNKHSRNVLATTNDFSSVGTLMTNWDHTEYVESSVEIPYKYQGHWIVNEQGQVENIMD